MITKLPYLPSDREILFVPEGHPFLLEAKKAAETGSLDTRHPTGAVVVRGEKILGRGANGSAFHAQFGCARKLLHIATGTHYWLCPGCSPKNHAEQSAIDNAIKNGESCEGADLYLYGHWWCCESCWGKMIRYGIRNVYLVEGAEAKFGR